jgi:hypothetical protein
LGHLYDIARQQIVRLGSIAHPEAPGELDEISGGGKRSSGPASEGHNTPFQDQEQQQDGFGIWPADMSAQGYYSQFMGHYAGETD